jgi:hypothetical protein
VELAKTFLTPLIRNAMASLAGWLALKGLLSQDETTQFVTSGVALTLSGGAYAWSVWQKTQEKRNADAMVKIAIKEPNTTTVAQVREIASDTGKLSSAL